MCTDQGKTCPASALNVSFTYVFVHGCTDKFKVLGPDLKRFELYITFDTDV